MIDIEASVYQQRHEQGVLNMVKTRADLDRYEQLIAKVRPAWIIETGTYNGASAVWFAEQADCRVITIDTHPQVPPELHGHRDITWIKGNSADPTIVTLVQHVVRGGGPVMVVLDSDHSAKHVRAEMDAYGPMVSPESYMVVEDGIIRWIPEQLVHYGNSSPLDAIEQFLADHHDDWVPDQNIEDLHPATQHPSGWLWRSP